MHVYGSANLVQTLLKHDLVDAFWLKIFPISLGGGKRLFADGTIPTAFKLRESTVTSKGVVIVNYDRSGAHPTKALSTFARDSRPFHLPTTPVPPQPSRHL